MVAPILQKLIFNREPDDVLDWADKVSRWSIKRIIPSHLANDIKATSKDFRRAFSFLEAKPNTQNSIFNLFNGGSTSSGPRPLESDLQVLNAASEVLTKRGVIKPEAPLVTRRIYSR